MARTAYDKTRRAGTFRLQHVPSSPDGKHPQPPDGQSAPTDSAQAVARPGVAPEPGSPDALVAAIGDLLLAEWMAENLPILRKTALTPLRPAANTPGPDRETEVAA